MRSLANLALGATLTGVAATGAVLIARRVALDGAWAPPFAAALPALLAIAVVGRVVLSVMPAGPLGSHRISDFPTTWAASHLVGVAALGFASVLLDLVDAGAGFARTTALLAPFGLILVLRVATLPGAMVPRHEPRREHLTGPFRVLPIVLATACALAVVAAFATGPAAPTPSPTDVATPLFAFFAALTPGAGGDVRALGVASWIAAALFVAHALGVARRAPAARHGAALALVLTPFALEQGSTPELSTALFVAGGAAGGVAWLRRADRRGRALALVAFVALPLTSWSGLVLGGAALLLLAAFTPAPSRRPFFLTGAVSWALVSWPIASHLAFDASRSGRRWLHAGAASRIDAALDLAAFGVAPIAASVGVALALGVLVRSARGRSASPLVPGRELGFALALAASTFAVLGPGWPIALTNAAQGTATAHWAHLGILVVLPTAVLAATMALARSERT